MTKGVVIFGLVAGGTVGLFIPRLFGVEAFGIANVITAVIGAVAGLLAIGAVVHFFGRIQ